MAENMLLNENGVTVTSTRFIVGGQTYAMSGVTSVKTLADHPSRKGPLICGALGLFGLFGGKETLLGGIIMLVIAIAWFMAQKSSYIVVLSTAGGEVEALSSKDMTFIAGVVNSLNQAIIDRG